MSSPPRSRMRITRNRSTRSVFGAAGVRVRWARTRRGGVLIQRGVTACQAGLAGSQDKNNYDIILHSLTLPQNF